MKSTSFGGSFREYHADKCTGFIILAHFKANAVLLCIEQRVCLATPVCEQLDKNKLSN